MTASDDDAVDPAVEERPQGSTRERRPGNTRLISVGASVSVSADERGELSGAVTADAGRTDATPDCTVFLQRGSGIERPRGRGDDGADTGAEGGEVNACSLNDTWRTGSGLGTDSVFL
jgi:hypothetical protein